MDGICKIYNNMNRCEIVIQDINVSIFNFYLF